MKKKSIHAIVAIAGASLAITAYAESGGFEIDWSTVDCGGGVSSGVDFELAGTIGQPDAGPPMTGGEWAVTGGFWADEGTDSESCPADLDGSGAVDFGDILSVLGAWGPCGGACPQDLDGSGAVDFGDLLVILGSWGVCP